MNCEISGSAMATTVQHSPRRTRALARETAPTTAAAATAVTRTPSPVPATSTKEILEGMMREITQLREERRRDRELHREELRRWDEERQQLIQISRSDITNIPNEERRGTASASNSLVRGNFKIKVDTYDGKGPLLEFLEQFEIVAQAYDWNDREKVMMLATNLRGRARSIMGSREKVTSMTFGELCSKLKLRFGDKLQTRTYASLFANRRQKYGEGITEFGAEIERLAERAYPGFSLEMCDNIACDRFISGLSNNYVKQKLLEEDFVSLRDAMERGEALEQLEVKKEGKGNRNDRDRDDGKRNFRERKNYYNTNYNDKERRNVRKNFRENEKGEEERKEKGERYRENRKDAKGNVRSRECWNCGSTEHFRAECPSLLKNKEN